MTDQPDLSRRNLGLAAVGVAATAALAPALAGAQPLRDPDLTQGDWMKQVKAQHLAIDTHMRRVEEARSPLERERHFRRVKALLSAHSYAEDVSLYPGLAMVGHRDDAKQLYNQQDDAKILTAELDSMSPGDPRFMDKFRTLAAAVRAHVREEEDRDYPELMRRADPNMNRKMTNDFRREFQKAITA